jgi:sugar phosphate permease
MGLLEIIYVVIMILLLVGVFGSAAAPNNFPWWPVANPIVYFILFVIIGLVIFGGSRIVG